MGNSASAYADSDDELVSQEIDWTQATGFEALFVTQPGVLLQTRKPRNDVLGSMRKLANATPLQTDQALGVDENCICKNLIARIAEYQRARHPHPEPGLELDVTLSRFLDAESKCPACSSMRRRLRSIGLPALAQTEYSEQYLAGNIKVALRNGMIASNADLRWEFGEFMAVQDDRSKTAEAYPSLVQFLATESKSDASMQKIAQWLQDCESHLKCKHESLNVMPSRILEVGTSSTPFCRLHITGEDERGKYAALSYCWGGYTGLMLKQNLLAKFQCSIDEASMPQTYTDAILLCRRLGIEYLWIDALCILQDSRPDWELENPRMAEVYGHAHLTISATSASSATQGFISSRDALDVTSVFMGTVSHHDEVYPVYLFEPIFEKQRDVELRLQSEQLMTRAWALQERMLAQRIVYFTTKGVLWQCRQRTITEDGMATGTNNRMISYIEDFQTPLREWYRIIDRFSECKLTNPTDRLPALAGLMKAFEKGGETFYFGHPKSDFVPSLIYGCTNSGNEPRHLAPSWSWASRKEQVYYQMKKTPDPDAQIVARILSWPQKSQVADLPTVRDAGRFTILAPAVDARVCRSADPGRPLWSGGCDAYLEGCPTQPLLLSIVIDDVRVQDAFDVSCVLVVLQLEGKPEEEKEQHGIVLAYVDGEGGDLRKIGSWQGVDEMIGPVQAVLRVREMMIV